MNQWRLGKDREFRVKILDPEWNKLNKPIALGLKTFRELDGTKLEFSNPNNPKVMHRPAARYLYFHYCMQVLQKAWQSREWQIFLGDQRQISPSQHALSVCRRAWP
ncbi:unnamed protein product [Penicillium salamii]|nr:unnamed protein product [Penicillium salamii]CAG8130579.1 unnamed protein product [Penicillium salamii]CAG8363146.1 unnamed protein product [Penicillium salamii]